MDGRASGHAVQESQEASQYGGHPPQDVDTVECQPTEGPKDAMIAHQVSSQPIDSAREMLVDCGFVAAQAKCLELSSQKGELVDLALESE